MQQPLNNPSKSRCVEQTKHKPDSDAKCVDIQLGNDKHANIHVYTSGQVCIQQQILKTHTDTSIRVPGAYAYVNL